MTLRRALGASWLVLVLSLRWTVSQEAMPKPKIKLPFNESLVPPTRDCKPKPPRTHISKGFWAQRPWLLGLLGYFEPPGKIGTLGSLG